MKFLFQYGKIFSIKLICYCFLFTITIFTNKYILSTLKFTYPTVFQGWQTLIASTFLLVAKIYSKENVIHNVLGIEFVRLLPTLIFHVLSIIAGSKALSAVPISIVLVAANIVNSITFLSLNNTVSTVQIASGGITFITSLLAIISQYGVVDKIKLAWLIAHIFFTIADTIYSYYIDIKISRIRKLWYTNSFSVVVLAPASLYLQEAFSALEFAGENKMKFFVSVVISGICGGMTQVVSTSIEYNNFAQSLAVILATVLSLIVFTVSTPFISSFPQILVINVISHCVLCSSETLYEKHQKDLLIV